ncbi:MAG: HAD family hydrolase [Promethearchaeota archaeon]
MVIPRSSRIQCVLFDLDNTLLGIPDTYTYFDIIIQDVMMNRYHLSDPGKEQRDQLWRSGKKYIQLLKSWGVEDPEDFWRQFDKIDSEKRKNLIEAKKLILYEDVLPTLTALREKFKVKIGIVTNTPTFIAINELEAYNLIPLFDEISGLGADQSICKPEPTGLLLTLEQLQCLPSETMYVGDSSIDIIAAIRAEILPVLIDRSGHKIHHLQDIDSNLFHNIKNLEEILAFL